MGAFSNIQVEEVCAATSRERLKVTFSPKDSDLVVSNHVMFF